MGIDLPAFKLLCEVHRKIGSFGKVLTLGRQGIHSSVSQNPAADRMISEYGIDARYADIGRREKYAEQLLRAFGASEIASIDASPYEGASIIHDFNNPLSPGIPINYYDIVLDGGFLEHIFNVPQAVANMMQMTQLGGRVVGITCLNNFVGHGFYQFSPEFIYRAFSDANGFEVEDVYTVELDGQVCLIPAEDPKVRGQRIETRKTKEPAYIMYVTRKTRTVEPFREWPQQSDYQIVW
jgi:hypothetical protein